MSKTLPGQTDCWFAWSSKLHLGGRLQFTLPSAAASTVIKKFWEWLLIRLQRPDYYYYYYHQSVITEQGKGVSLRLSIMELRPCWKLVHMFLSTGFTLHQFKYTIYVQVQKKKN